MKPSNRSTPLARRGLRAVRQRRGDGQPEMDEQRDGLAKHGEIFVKRVDLAADPVQAARHGRLQPIPRIAGQEGSGSGLDDGGF